jgi:hypothetical protein
MISPQLNLCSKEIISRSRLITINPLRTGHRGEFEYRFTPTIAVFAEAGYNAEEGARNKLVQTYLVSDTPSKVQLIG